jgi:hypothetical protein
MSTAIQNINTRLVEKYLELSRLQKERIDIEKQTPYPAEQVKPRFKSFTEDFVRDQYAPAKHKLLGTDKQPRFFETSSTGNSYYIHLPPEARFGDIVNVMDGNSFYSGFRFIGAQDSLVTTERANQASIYDGITVPYEIACMFKDAVGYYSQTSIDIVRYELAYHDATVQKYNVAPGYLYEYSYNVRTRTWSLEMISQDGSRMTAMPK